MPVLALLVSSTDCSKLARKVFRSLVKASNASRPDACAWLTMNSNKRIRRNINHESVVALRLLGYRDYPAQSRYPRAPSLPPDERPGCSRFLSDAVPLK